MKKLLTIALLLVISMTTFAQKDVTKFLGIPVDGTKSAMIQKLKEKGFVENSLLDCLEGEFNGKNVDVYILTNKNKVWRIAVIDHIKANETDIKTRFNRLCRQFDRNEKYIQINPDTIYTLSDDENIKYGISLHNKQYEAAYYQRDLDWENRDSIADKKAFEAVAASKYSKKQIANPTKEQKDDMDSMYLYYVIEKNYSKYDRIVWFSIGEYNGGYIIRLFYDNENNRADGEDL